MSLCGTKVGVLVGNGRVVKYLYINFSNCKILLVAMWYTSSNKTESKVYGDMNPNDNVRYDYELAANIIIALGKLSRVFVLELVDISR